MWSTVNVSEEDRATDTGNVHKQFGKDSACFFGDILADRQTDTQTDMLITILRNRSRGRSKYYTNAMFAVQKNGG